MKTRFVYLFLCLSLSCIAQQDYNEWPKEEQKKLENAKYLMDDKLYLLAHERFDALLKLHPDNTYVKYLTGICAIYLTDKRDEAAKYLAEVKTANSKAVDLDYYYAIFYHRNYEFDKCTELATKLIY